MEQAIYVFSPFCARKYNSLFFQYIAKEEALASRRGRALPGDAARLWRARKRAWRPHAAAGPAAGPPPVGRARAFFAVGRGEDGEGGPFHKARHPARRRRRFRAAGRWGGSFRPAVPQRNTSCVNRPGRLAEGGRRMGGMRPPVNTCPVFPGASRCASGPYGDTPRKKHGGPSWACPPVAVSRSMRGVPRRPA